MNDTSSSTSGSFTSSKLAEARALLKEPERAAQICHEILAQHRPDPPDRDLCETHYLLGVSHRLCGHLSEAEGELLYAQQLAQALHEDQLLAQSSLDLGLLSIELVQYDRAIEQTSKALALLEAPEHTLARAKARYALANACWLKGEQAVALKHMEKALLEFTDVNSEDGAVAVLSALVHVDIERGRYKEAEERIDLCMKLMTQDSHSKNRLFLRLTHAECCSKQGKDERALEILESAASESNTTGYHFFEAQALMQIQKLRRERGDIEQSDELREHAYKLAQLHGFTQALEALDQEGHAKQ